MRISLTTLLLLAYISAFTQQETYSAKVVNARNEALIGATVNQVGTDNFTVTDLDGVFALRDCFKTSAAGEKPGFCRQSKAIFHCIAPLRS